MADRRPSRAARPGSCTVPVEAIGGVLVPLGSAGAKVMAVVRGEAEVYVHSGGQWAWDNAAPVAVAQSYGLYARRLDGSVMTYNERNNWVPDLVVCHPALTDRVRLALDE
jgi:3'(2'), 5'-bisphosphate nucleotidase